MEPDVIDAVDRTLAILECFTSERPVLGISEISRELGLHKSAVFRSLVSLKARGLISRDPQTRRYMVGAKILRPAGAYLRTVDLHEKARPIVEALRARTKETISLYVPAGDRGVCIERLESPLEIRRVVSIGDQVPLHVGSTGKVLLAHMAEPAQSEYLSHLRDEIPNQSPPADRARLLAELALIREHGVATSHEERVPQVSSASAPIFGATGEVAAVLTVSGPSARFDVEHLKRCSALVKEATGQISEQIGFGLYRKSVNSHS